MCLFCLKEYKKAKIRILISKKDLLDFEKSNPIIDRAKRPKQSKNTEENTSITAMQAPSRAATARKVIKSGNLTINRS